MKKTFEILITVIFCGFILSTALLTILLPKRDFSEFENRYLQKAPRLTLETLMSGEFSEDAESFCADHVFLRDEWVALKAYMSRFTGKHENGGVYFGADGTLISKVDSPDGETITKKAEYVSALSENISVPVYFGLVPTAASVWADKLPKNAPNADEKAVIGELYEKSGADCIDLCSALESHAREEIYYRTDHHWTSLGAFYGANAIFDAMGLENISLSDYEKTTVSDNFYGTAWSRSGARWISPDSIDIYVHEDGIDVMSMPDTKLVEGKLYYYEHLEEKDKYSFFLGGNQPLCIIKTKNDGQKILVIRDSYCDSLAPFLTERFSEIHLFDLRYNRTSIKSYVEENSIDAVLVLYNISTFSEDANTALLAR